jgi:hypothetical protein
MTRALVVVPRWGGNPASDYYPWLTEQLREQTPPPFEPIQVLGMPRPEQPEISTWVPALAAAADALPAEQTVLVGHSVGCQAVLRYLAAQPEGRRFAGVLLVAAWWTVDQPWPSLLPWQEPVPRLERARAAAGRVVVLLSDNDPFTADPGPNGQLWRERLGAEVRLVPGAKHFNGAREPAVLEALSALAGR